MQEQGAILSPEERARTLIHEFVRSTYHLSTWGYFYAQYQPLQDKIAKALAGVDELERDLAWWGQSNERLAQENAELKARLTGYEQMVVMHGPFNLKAIPGAKEPVKLPTPESLTKILDALAGKRGQ